MRAWVGWLAGIVVAWLAAPAHAAPWAVTDPRARQLARDGKAAYDRGDFARAADRFTAAWTTEHATKIAFALAQSHRKLGAWKQAIEFYDLVIADATAPADQRDLATKARDIARLFDVAASLTAGTRFADARRYYLDLLKVRDLGDDDRDRATQALDDLTRRDAEATPLANVRELPSAPAPAARAPSGVDSPEPAAHWYSDRGAWVLGTGGVLGAAVGGRLLSTASSLDADANANANATERDRLHDRASTRRTIGSVVAAAGGAMLVAGVIKFALVPTQTRPSSVMLTPGPGTVGLGVALSF